MQHHHQVHTLKRRRRSSLNPKPQTLNPETSQAVKHGLLFVRIIHAIGDVPIGEASVLVQVCPHCGLGFRV